MNQPMNSGRRTGPSGQSILASSWLPLLVLAGSLVLAYGYELFSFNLTVDEDSIALLSQTDLANISLRENRWAMAALFFLLPNPVAPLVSNGLAILLSGLAWWALARHSFSLPRWPAALIGAVAGTLPMFAFILSFSTIAFAIGIGNLLLVGFATGIISKSWLHRMLGVLAAAAAIAIYDTFLVAVAAIALGLIARRPQLPTVMLGLGGAISALLLSKGIGWAVSLISGVAVSGYTSGFFDLAGVIAHPIGRMKSALNDVWGVVTLSPERFGLSSEWFAILVIVVTATAIATSFLGQSSLLQKSIRLVATLGLVALPVFVELIAPVVLLRSMFYLPIAFIAIAAIAWHGLAKLTVVQLRPVQIVAIALIALTVIGNATITNRLFSIAATTYALDRNLAFAIGQEKDRLLAGDNSQELPVVVSGLHSWPRGTFTDSRETLGMSFFDLNAERTTKFLNAHGVLVEIASDDEIRNAQQALRDMPGYPEPGWMVLEDDVLILNFEHEGAGE